MLGSYIKITLRSFLKHKLFTGINLFSLAISMSAGLIIIAMVSDLIKYDEFHENKNDISRVTSFVKYSNGFRDEKASSPRILIEYVDQIPGVINAVTLSKGLPSAVSTDEHTIPLQGLYASNDFFEVFTFQLVAGNPATALSDPFSAVITESGAMKVFGDVHAVGKTIRIGEDDFRISAVAADVPKHSHIQFEILASSRSIKTDPEWTDLHSSYVYLLSSPGADLSLTAEAINKLAEPSYRNESLEASFYLQDLTAILPGEDLSNQLGPKMIYLPVIILGSLSLIILLAASFNFSNLSLARLLSRSKEVGLRKIMGGKGKQITSQILIETVILSVASLLAAILVFFLIRPGFLQMVPRAREVFTLELSLTLISAFILFAIVVGLIAGLVPAIHFSRVKPSDALKSNMIGKALSVVTFRKTVIVVQFTLSLLFITGVLIISKQYNFSVNYDFGFQTNGIVNVEVPKESTDQLRTEILNFSEVTEISHSSLIPGLSSTTVLWLKRENSQDSIESRMIAIDHRFIENLEVQLLAGRSFEAAFEAKGEPALIVNKKFLEFVKVVEPSSILDEYFLIDGQPHKVVGVVNDFNYSHLEEPIEPFVFTNNPAYYNYMNISYEGDVEVLMSKLEEAWKKEHPDQEMKANIFTDEIANAYVYLLNFAKLFGYFGAVAVTIALLGLFGIVVYDTERRIKEIGIRKTLGSTTRQIISLLSRSYLRLLMIAGLISLPMVYLLFDKVILALNFYRTSVTIADLLSGLAIVTVLSLLLISSRTIKAAETNPAISLKNE